MSRVHRRVVRDTRADRPTVSLVSAPTLWEEGRLSGDRTTRLSLLVCLLLVVGDVLAQHRLGLIFDAGLVAVCVGAALAVRPRDFFTAGVLPPMLLLVVCTTLSLVHRSAIAAPGDGFVQGVVTGLARHAAALATGYALCLAVLAMRHRVISRRQRRVGDVAGYSKREASPAPYLTTSGTPEDRSTTVVGSEPHTPQSTTASSR